MVVRWLIGWGTERRTMTNAAVVQAYQNMTGHAFTEWISVQWIYQLSWRFIIPVVVTTRRSILLNYKILLASFRIEIEIDVSILQAIEGGGHWSTTSRHISWHWPCLCLCKWLCHHYVLCIWQELTVEIQNTSYRKRIRVIVVGSSHAIATVE